MDRAAFDRYERDYLKRQCISPQRMTADQLYVKHVRDTYTATSLTQDDILMLDIIHHDDWLAPYGMGPMRSIQSLLRLYCHGLIYVVDVDDYNGGSYDGADSNGTTVEVGTKTTVAVTHPTNKLDRRARLRAISTHPVTTRYVKNLASVLSAGDKKFFRAACEIFDTPGVRLTHSDCHITRAGLDTLWSADRATHAKLRKHYAAEALNLYGMSESKAAGAGGVIMGAAAFTGGMLTGGALYDMTTDTVAPAGPPYEIHSF